ncbi:hypothetical protein RRG08_046034 [Elysia crispata]|uniref:Uncharacterized protein n=1 Tax=Elysia crispata TaxID=231223 RepID=A0AAE1DER0_9GAST|nr:hypothetical protein RRG08_046034 [Elysia crispata]
MLTLQLGLDLASGLRSLKRITYLCISDILQWRLAFVELNVVDGQVVELARRDLHLRNQIIDYGTRNYRLGPVHHTAPCWCSDLGDGVIDATVHLKGEGNKIFTSWPDGNELKPGLENEGKSEQRTETHEYPSEDSALQTYLEEHPNEPEDDVIFMDTSGGGLGESSDDKDEEEEEEGGAPVTPRGGAGHSGEDELLKSNTSLSSVGTLQSYRGRFQEDFDFDARLREPEPVKQTVVESQPEDPESMMLRPAEEEENNTWSSSARFVFNKVILRVRDMRHVTKPPQALPRETISRAGK